MRSFVNVYNRVVLSAILPVAAGVPRTLNQCPGAENPAHLYRRATRCHSILVVDDEAGVARGIDESAIRYLQRVRA
jgi:hypothetical protein